MVKSQREVELEHKKTLLEKMKEQLKNKKIELDADEVERLKNEAIEKKRLELAEQKTNEQIAKEKAWDRTLNEYRTRCSMYAVNNDGFDRFVKFLIAYSKGNIVHVDHFIKEMKLEKLKAYLDELLPKGEKPPVKKE